MVTANRTGTIPSEVGSMTAFRLCIHVSRNLIADTNIAFCTTFYTDHFFLSGPAMDGIIPTEIGLLAQLGSSCAIHIIGFSLA